MYFMLVAHASTKEEISANANFKDKMHPYFLKTPHTHIQEPYCTDFNGVDCFISLPSTIPISCLSLKAWGFLRE
jgi:hypothetical protein